MGAGIWPSDERDPLDLPASYRYRDEVRVGHRVRLPDGRNGTVRMIETVVDGADKVVSIDVEGAKRRWFGLKPPIPVRMADEEIDLLVEIPTEEEIQRIMDDPTEFGLEP